MLKTRLIVLLREYAGLANISAQSDALFAFRHFGVFCLTGSYEVLITSRSVKTHWVKKVLFVMVAS